MKSLEVVMRYFSVALLISMLTAVSFQSAYSQDEEPSAANEGRAGQQDEKDEKTEKKKGRYHHEFRAGVGIFSVPDIYNLSSALVTESDIGATEARAAELVVPAVFLEYSYYFGKHILATLHGSYQKFSVEHTSKISQEVIGTYEDEFYTGMLGFQWYYISDFVFELYSGVMAGVSQRQSTVTSGDLQEDDAQLFAFHANLLGIRFGGPLAVQAEVGFGYKGIINAAVMLRF